MNKQNLQRYGAAGIVSLLTFAIYVAALQNDFVSWDDDLYVYENPNIRILDRAFLRWAFSSFYASNWHPLTWISHAVDYAVWGLNPLGHHLTNIVLHGMNTYLVVLLAAKLLHIAKERMPAAAVPAFLDQRGMLIAAAVTGLLFGVHPIHVESAAWIAERKDLLCGLFFLLSTAAYIRYALPPPSSGQAERERWGAYLLSLACFALALLSKPMAVSLPVVLLILDWYPLRRRFGTAIGELVVEKLPFIGLSLGASVLTIMAQRTGDAMTMLAEVPFWGRTLVAAKSLVAYLGNMIAPLGLSPYYPYPDRQEVLRSLPHYLAACLFVAGITAVLFVIAKRQKVWLAAWGYYVATLLPVLGIVQVGLQAMADRYTYLPGIGPFLIAGLASAWIWEREDALQRTAAPVKALTAVAAAALVIALSMATLEQISLWKNGVDLWDHVLERNPGRVPFAYNNRGLAYRERGDYDRALADFQTAEDQAATQLIADMARHNHAVVLEEKERIDRAMDVFRQAIALKPNDARAYVDRGIAFSEAGQARRAMEDFDTAIDLDPASADAYTSRGLLFAEAGQIERAIEEYTTAIRHDPAGGDAYLNRGVALGRRGRVHEALADFDRAIALDPADYAALCERGIVYRKLGRAAEAEKDLSSAIALDPSFIKAYLERGGLYRHSGNAPLAARDFQKACDLGDDAGCGEVHDRKGR